MTLPRCLAPILCLALSACAARYAPAARCLALGARENTVALDDSETISVAGAPSEGPSDAPVTVVSFGDFQCPYCARGRVTLRDLRALHPELVRVVWRDLPLERHADAPLAAEAAREAFAQGGDALFWRFHDALFAHPEGLTRPHLERYAAALGMDLPRFRHALDEHTHQPGIEADRAMAERLHVGSTPTFYVNGTEISGAQPIEVFEALVALNVERARTLPPRRRYADAVRAPLVVPNELLPPDAWERVHALEVPAGAASRGPANARVVVQIFSDFECPYCARVLPTLNELRSYYGDRVRWVWRDFPLPRHRRAGLAAEAAREALAQRGSDGFWRYHDALFAHQHEPGALDRAALEAYAQSLELDLPRFRHALDEHTHQAAVQADAQAAEDTGVRMGTPAFFINGHFFSGARPAAEFQARIDPMLRAQ